MTSLCPATGLGPAMPRAETVTPASIESPSSDSAAAVDIHADRASTLCEALLEGGFSPFFGTPCGILAPLYSQLERRAGLRTVAREDNAVGVAAGAAMAGKCPAVLMQNSGLGQSVNAIASLVVPYGISMLLIVSMRGMAPDSTTENTVMGRITEPLLNDSGVPTAMLEPASMAEQVQWARSIVAERREPAALLVPPTLFGWQP